MIKDLNQKQRQIKDLKYQLSEKQSKITKHFMPLKNFIFFRVCVCIK